VSVKSLSNIPVKDFRKFLKKLGCTKHRTKGVHEHWTKPGINRPLTFQSNKDPIPEFIVKNLLRVLELSKDDYFRIMEKK
jgi:predicted RNA binding protein YcfA (HicA-like mRNA interferase family)